MRKHCGGNGKHGIRGRNSDDNRCPAPTKHPNRLKGVMHTFVLGEFQNTFNCIFFGGVDGMGSAE